MIKIKQLWPNLKINGIVSIVAVSINEGLDKNDIVKLLNKVSKKDVKSMTKIEKAIVSTAGRLFEKDRSVINGVISDLLDQGFDGYFDTLYEILKNKFEEIIECKENNKKNNIDENENDKKDDNKEKDDNEQTERGQLVVTVDMTKVNKEKIEAAIQTIKDLMTEEEIKYIAYRLLTE